MATALPHNTLTVRLRNLLETQAFERFIVAVIVVNAIVLGLETSPTVMARVGPLLVALDIIALSIFIAEIAAKLWVYRAGFFQRPWNIFDFIVVGIALIPNVQGLQVLRSLRILRAMRLMSMVPKMRLVVQALLQAIPGMGSVIALLLLVFYVFAVMATKLFGSAFPDWFGTVGASFYSLFQIMTLESWSMGIVRPVMDVFPFAWLFFVPFILLTTFAVLNLFIAIVVNSMQEVHEADTDELQKEHREVMRAITELRAEVAALRRERTGKIPPEQG